MKIQTKVLTTVDQFDLTWDDIEDVEGVYARNDSTKVRTVIGPEPDCEGGHRCRVRMFVYGNLLAQIDMAAPFTPGFRYRRTNDRVSIHFEG